MYVCMDASFVCVGGVCVAMGVCSCACACSCQ